MWMLVIIAVHSNNIQDQPAKISLEFPTAVTCERSLQSLQYQLKYNSYKLEGRCERKA